ncbi:MAG: hypothetical protein K9N51_07815 [Candidatus Pacebacteria bacterium]|nr:hypothetical protein [Candidatus Paceibacterota bacterium]
MKHALKTVRRRFTIIEAMFFVLAASILAITALAMLYYLYRGVSDARENVDMQRDASVAVVFLKHELRAAESSEIDVDGDEITIDTDSGDRRFYVVGGNTLMFDPDTGAEGDEIPLVRDRLVGFTAEKLSGRVKFEIVIEEDGESVTVDGIVQQRN